MGGLLILISMVAGTGNSGTGEGTRTSKAG